MQLNFPDTLSATYSITLARTSGGSSCELKICLMTRAEMPETLYLPDSIAHAVLRETPSAFAWLSTVNRPQRLRHSAICRIFSTWSCERIARTFVQKFDTAIFRTNIVKSVEMVLNDAI